MHKLATLALLACLVFPATANAQQQWTSEDGILTLTIPSDWRKVSGKATIFEAKRYAADPDRWARCTIMSMNVPNLRGRTQEEVNMSIETMTSPLVADHAARGTRIVYSYAVFDGVRYKVARFDKDGMTFEMRQGAAVRGDSGHMIHLECEVAIPLTAQDKTDVLSFLDSARIGHP